MNGEIPLHEVFPRRMEIIRPDKALCETVAHQYIETIVGGVRETLQTLREDGWTIVIISGGFAPLIKPLAETLGVEFVEAVPLFLDESGGYAGYDAHFPSTRNGGKPEIIREWKAAMRPKTTVMVGDGISDLESQNEVDMFIGFGGVVIREVVKNSAQHFVESFTDIPALAKKAAKRK
jgi:phosphoserine phosphatase